VNATPKTRNILEVLGPLIGAAPREDQPLLAALAERVAARRYRKWAEAVDDSEASRALRACAAREEDIATRVEATNPHADQLQRSFAAKHPDLEGLYWSLFEGASLLEQFAIQAQAERTGATTWRAFARQASDPAVATAFESCASLEEQSAAVLDDLISQNVSARADASSD
jgi:rubrerythrin